MTSKLFEIRDRATLIPVLCTNCSMLKTDDYREIWLLRRSGYGHGDMIIMTVLHEPDRTRNDPYEWTTSARTIPEAHRYIEQHWDELKTGDVIDVEFILGETKEPKKSEQEDERL